MREIDQSHYFEAVAKYFKGEPTKQSNIEMRYGNNGSLCVNIAMGTFFCHETSKSGDMFTFIQEYGNKINYNEAVKWFTEFFNINEEIKPKKKRVDIVKRENLKAEYSYNGITGIEHYKVRRYESVIDGTRYKEFRPARLVDGTYKNGFGDADRIPYNLDKWYAKSKSEYLFFVEGEKCADVITARNLNATTMSNGANSLKKGDFSYLAARRVVILRDNDEAGKKWQQALIGQLLKNNVFEIKTVEFEGLPPKGDIVEWFAQGNTEKDLIELVEKTPSYEALKQFNEQLQISIDTPMPNRNWPHTMINEKGIERPINTKQNFQFLLDQYGIIAQYNEINKRLQIYIPRTNYSVDNNLNCSFSDIRSICHLNGFPVSNMESYLENVADNNRFNPIEKWLDSKPWDGKERIKDFCATVQVKKGFDLTLRNQLIRKWLMSCVAAATMKNYVGKGVLTFQGAQNVGKTTWLRNLVPDSLSQYVKEDVILDPGNKDSVKLTISHWIVELGEVDATFKKSDIARLKGFISSSFDIVRLPYARGESHFPRRTVLFASVNDDNFLVDQTGNVRFWTIPVVKLKYDHRFDMQQVFAEAYDGLKSGEEWWLCNHYSKLLAESNKEFQKVNPIEDLLLETFDFDKPSTIQMNIGTICDRLKISQTDNNSLYKLYPALKSLNIEKGRTGKMRYYNMPPLKSGVYEI